MISGWIWLGHVLGRLCEIHTHTFLLYSLSFWTVIVHTFTAFKRCNASHGASFPQKTMCFSPSHSFSWITAAQKYSTKTESQLENAMKPYKYLTAWNHHHNSQQNDKKTFPNAAEVFLGYLREYCTHVGSFEKENNALGKQSFKQSPKIYLQ